MLSTGKTLNIYDFLKFVQTRVFMQAKGKVSLKHMVEAIAPDRYSKVLGAFIKLLGQYMEQFQTPQLNRLDFMNYSMLLYSMKKPEVETLVRTYENLTKTDNNKSNSTPKADISRNSLLSHPSKEQAYMHGLNLNSKVSASKLKASGYNSIKFPLSSRKQKSKGEKNDVTVSSSALSNSKHNWSLLRFIASKNSCKNTRKSSKKAQKVSRNKDVKKSKSISEDTKNRLKIEAKQKANFSKCIGSISSSLNITNKQTEEHKEEGLSNTEYFSTNLANEKNDKTGISAIYCTDAVNSTPRNASVNQKEGVLSGETNKFKKVANSGLVPHGGGAEKLNNEERLNILTDHSPSKFEETKALFDIREKSIDLSLKSGSFQSGTHDLLSSKLINSNKLSKYLTGIIGNKDFRSSEERELAK